MKIRNLHYQATFLRRSGYTYSVEISSRINGITEKHAMANPGTVMITDEHSDIMWPNPQTGWNPVNSRDIEELPWIYNDPRFQPEFSDFPDSKNSTPILRACALEGFILNNKIGQVRTIRKYLEDSEGRFVVHVKIQTNEEIAAKKDIEVCVPVAARKGKSTRYITPFIAFGTDYKTALEMGSEHMSESNPTLGRP